jgi:hypothetical protein
VDGTHCCRSAFFARDIDPIDGAFAGLCWPLSSEFYAVSKSGKTPAAFALYLHPVLFEEMEFSAENGTDPEFNGEIFAIALPRAVAKK